MGQATVDLGFRAAPFVIDKVWVAGTLLGFGAHTGSCAAGVGCSQIGQQLFAVNTLELARGAHSLLLEPAAQGGSQRAATHLPELCHLNARGVELQGCTHRREEAGFGAAGMEYELGLVLQGVDGIDNVVVGFEVEVGSGFFGIDLLPCFYLRRGVDGEQPLPQCLHLHHAYGLGGGHELAVDVGDADAVGVDNGEVADAGAHEAFRAPAAYAAHSDDDDAQLSEPFHDFFAQQPLGAVEYGFFYLFHA